MRSLIAAAIAISVFAAPAFAAKSAGNDAMKSCAAAWQAMSAADKAKTTYKDYMGTCMKAKPAAAASTSSSMSSMSMSAKPAAAGSMQMAAPAGGGSAKCKDGTTVTYKNRQGTCSGHGGVASWM